MDLPRFVYPSVCPLMNLWVVSTIPVTFVFCLVTLQKSLTLWHSEFPFSLPEISKPLSKNIAQRTCLQGTLPIHHPPILLPPKKKGRKLIPLSLKAIRTFFFFFFSISNAIDLCSLGKSIEGVTTDYTTRKEILKESSERVHT